MEMLRLMQFSLLKQMFSRQTENSPFWVSFFLMLVSSSISSFSPISIKLVTVSFVSSAFYRFFFGLIGATIVLFLQGQLRQVFYQCNKYLLLGGLFFSVDVISWYYWITIIGPGLSTIIISMQVLFIAVFSVCFLKEPFRISLFSSILLCLIGIYFLCAPQWEVLNLTSKIAIFGCFLTALCYAGFIITMRILREDSKRILLVDLWWVLFICTTISCLAMFRFEGSFVIFSNQDWVVLLINGVFVGFFVWWLVLRSMTYIPITIVGVLLLMQPLFAVIFDSILFNFSITSIKLLGLGLSFLGIYFACSPFCFIKKNKE